jgi:hypothetical protein
MTTQPAPQAAPAADHPVAHFPKQAIVVVHGMGEQMPMDTIKAFVRAAWQTTTGLATPDLPNPTQVWSKPDVRTGSLELRRITTRQSVPSPPIFPGGVRSDFYELYWADLSGGSTWNQVKDWIFGLLFRNPFTRVPRDVRLAWVVLWLIALVVAFVLLAAAMPKEAHLGSLDLWKVPPLSWLQGLGWLVTALVALFASIAASFIVPYFGRVVRYTVAKPDNIAARENIRKRGLALLCELHKKDYDRIILVGHSLGSILAYDLIGYFWARREAQRNVTEGTAEFAALLKLETAIAALASHADGVVPPQSAIDDYLAAQTEFGHLLRVRAKPADGQPDARWLISDFITLGSPLSHAEFLMANSTDDLRQRRQDREYPTSPPLRELLDPGYETRAITAGFQITRGHGQLLAFPFNPTQWQLHYACPFAATRWTNIHDPARLVAFGDLISGPVAPQFGYGIIDVDLRELRGQSRCFTHTHYWKLDDDQPDADPPRHIVELRKALDLLGQRSL